MMPARLSSQDLEAIAGMFKSGVGADEIGRLYDVTGRAIRYRLAARGLRYRSRTLPKWTDFRELRRGQIHLLRGRGLGFAEMSRELGMLPNTLIKWLRRRMPEIHAQMKAEAEVAREQSRRAGQPAPARRPVTAEDRAQIETLYREGHSIAAIARHLGRSLSVVGRVLVEENVARRAQRRRSPMWLRASHEHRTGRDLS
jgi:IS30 family transposase